MNAAVNRDRYLLWYDLIRNEARVWFCIFAVPCIIDLARLQAGFVVFTLFAEAPSTACAMYSLPGRGRYGWAGGMHATLLRVYRVMPCIEHPIGWYDQCRASWQMEYL